MDLVSYVYFLLTFLVNIAQTKTKTDTFEDLMTGYDNQKSPYEGSGPTTIQLGVYVNSVSSIDEQSMEYAINIYLRQSWTDPRLIFTPEYGLSYQMIKLDGRAFNRIWVPDVFFRNEKSGNFHAVTIPNRLLRIYSDGKVWYSVKLTVTLSCPMDLQKFPFDTQICPMLMESFGHMMDTIKFTWLPGEAVSTKPNLALPQFSLTAVDLFDCSRNYTSGAYPCLQVNFHVRRDSGYYLLQVYIPSLLVVILSWFAFWLNHEAVTARVFIGLLTVLTMVTQSTGVRTSLPRVSYIKAIDVWMLICLLCVFSALLESAALFYLINKSGIKPSGEILPLSIKDESRVKEPATEKVKTQLVAKIDFISRIAFPALFLFFNIIYWTQYLT